MHSVTIKKVSPVSYVWVSVLSFIAIGVLLGIVAFIGSMFGLPVENEVFGRDFHGAQAGALSLVLGPPVLGILGAIAGVLSYPLFSVMLRLFRGIRIHGQFEP